MNSATTPLQSSPLEQAARPLLRLAQNISGVESTFITSIDWDALNQTVLYSNNQGVLDVEEGVALDWHESMCRSLLLNGVTHSCEVGVGVPSTRWTVANGIQTFFAVPILVDDVTIGTVCGASQRRLVLDDTQVDSIRLIAEALRQLLQVELSQATAKARAEALERDVAEARDASRRHALHSQQMEHLAYTDVLTGLPNRRAFMTQWEDELARSGRRNYPIGLMLLDADRFESINDTDGHAMGDAVLRAIGATLMVVARPPDLVARLGGDEFALLSTHTDGAHLEDLAGRIRRHFKLVAAELGVGTTLSIGMATSDYGPRERLLADADDALYQSKDAGGNAARMFLCDDAPPDTAAGTPRDVHAA